MSESRNPGRRQGTDRGTRTRRARGGREPAATAVMAPRVLSLDGAGWRIATDPANRGREERWYEAPRPEAQPTPVPWIIQDVFPGYHGVAWYWQDLTVPANPHPAGATLLRFWAVDYQAEVWLNGVRLGGHDDGETPFVLDASAAVQPGTVNRLAVRVLNPGSTPVDGIVLAQTAHRNKTDVCRAGSAYNIGGIMDSVELLLVPVLRIDDLFVRPDPTTGAIRVDLSLHLSAAGRVPAQIELSVAPAAGGETLSRTLLHREVLAGDHLIETELCVAEPRRWDIDDPYLYRVTARICPENAPADADEMSVRCGFRDFRIADGAFRLNGRRLYLRCSHTGNEWPIGVHLPCNPDLARRDLLNGKVMGFNTVRFIAGVALRYQLDLCDEIGLMVYEESYAAWCLAESPEMGRRYDTSLLGMVRRDRNHPCVTIWGMLNETPDGPLFRHVAGRLPALRALDDTRLVLLNSGQWDRRSGGNTELAAQPQPPVGCVCNPGSATWEDVLSDQHPYQRVPHTAAVIRALREHGRGGLPLFLSEYGIGSGVDLVRLCRHFERLGKAGADEARFFAANRDRFLQDWEHWRLAEVFGRPEDYFAQVLAKMADQRRLGLNAIRANPTCIGHSLTGFIDHGLSGEGLTTAFREMKPGTVDALCDGWAPLRWCLFAEPVNVYRGGRVRLEAVLANEDALAAGTYPARFEVFGPEAQVVSRHDVAVVIPEWRRGAEPPFALPVFAADVPIDGPAGAYRFVASFTRGAAAAGGETRLQVFTDLPAVPAEVVLWGDDPGLAEWLTRHGIRSRRYDADAAPPGRELIVASGRATAPGGAASFRELTSRIARGSTVAFLTPETLADGTASGRWLPLRQKGALARLPRWLYLSDDWARRHPVFDGLPAGGLLDSTVYRDLIPDQAWTDMEPPDEAIAGAINTSFGYSAGLTFAGYRLGAGRFLVNALRLRAGLDRDPVAERLLRNLLSYASQDLGLPLAAAPAGLAEQWRSWGYE